MLKNAPAPRSYLYIAAAIFSLRFTLTKIEVCRDLAVVLRAFARAVINTMLVYSDDAYSMALIFYNMVSEMSRRGKILNGRS